MVDDEKSYLMSEARSRRHSQMSAKKLLVLEYVLAGLFKAAPRGVGHLSVRISSGPPRGRPDSNVNCQKKLS